MPAWSMANTCHTGLAPNPGSANACALASGTVLAWVSPAGLTTVPISVTNPLARVVRWLRGEGWHAAILATAERAGAYSVILQLWPMSSVRSMRPMPTHIAHDSARSVSSSSSNCSLQRVPEVLVVTQAGVVGGESVGELRGDALLLAVPRPGPPLRGVVVEVLVDAGGDALGVAGVLAHHAFVVERDHDAGQLPDPHRQPVLGVDRVGELGHRECRCRATSSPSRRRRRRRSLRFGSWRDRTPKRSIWNTF